MPNVVPRLFATAALGSLLLMGCPSSDDNSSGSGGQSGRGGAGGGSGGQSGGSGGAGQTGGTGGGSGGQSGGAGGGSGGQSGGTGGGAGGQSGAGGSGGRADAGRGGSGGGSADARGSGGSGGGRGDAGGAAKMAVANIATFSNGTITGTVTFVEVAGGVQVTYALENCPAGRHPTHIHSGNGCGSVGAQGMHWDVPRGENIGPNGGEITCGADNKGTLVHMRPNSGANTRWTIGDGSDSDVVGHPVVVHGIMDANARHGCGVIAVK